LCIQAGEKRLTRATKELVDWQGEVIDANRVYALARSGATNAEIAGALGVRWKTLRSRFGAAIRRGRANLRIALRSKQLQSACDEGGDARLLMWLGRQYLNQRDEPIGSRPEKNIKTYVQLDVEDV
jgi:hypothetical protein